MQKFKFASILLILVALTMCAVPSAFSAEKGAVHSEEILGFQEGDVISVPVILENADNLMGIKLTFTPSGKEVKVNNVKSGELAKNGFFNHNADINEGAFDVVWTGTEPIGENGVICYLEAECMEDFIEFSFKVSYSQPDTFDESFNDVELICDDIKFKGLVLSEDIEIEDLEDNSEDIEIDNKEEIIEKTDIILEKYNYTSINDVEDENVEMFIEEVCDSVEDFDLATKELDNNEKIDVLKDIYSTADDADKVQSDDKKDTPDDKFTSLPLKENKFLIIILPIGVLVVVIVSFLLIKRRKRNEKTDI